MSQAQDDNNKKFEDVKMVTDDLTGKLNELSNKLNDVGEKVSAIQDYLRTLAVALMSTSPGGPIVVSPPPW